MQYIFKINKIKNGIIIPIKIIIDASHEWFTKTLNDEVKFEDGSKGYIVEKIEHYNV